jgi:hypothetical protein
LFLEYHWFNVRAVRTGRKNPGKFAIVPRDIQPLELVTGLAGVRNLWRLDVIGRCPCSGPIRRNRRRSGSCANLSWFLQDIYRYFEIDFFRETLARNRELYLEATLGELCRENGNSFGIRSPNPSDWHETPRGQAPLRCGQDTTCNGYRNSMPASLLFADK